MTSQANQLLHYQPHRAWVGDPMPVYHNGIYHIYYTKLRDDGVMVWGHISTRDLIGITEHPDPLELGGPDDLDASSIKTGCVMVHEGTFHMFYAGTDKENTDHILHAVSSDGIRFCKEGKELFPIDPQWYRVDGSWRDPCVLWDEGCAVFRMFFCSRGIDRGPEPFPGRLATASSRDLCHWTLEPPAQAEGLSGVMECPDVFRLGDAWALLYYWHDTRIRFSDSLNGPWKRRLVLSPNHFDFMAAKHLWDGSRHLMAGWIPRKSCDCGERIWGGTLACLRELYMDESGNAACRFIRELGSVMSQTVPQGSLFNASLVYGQAESTEDGMALRHGFLYWDGVPDDYRLRFHIRADAKETVCTIFLRTGQDEERPWTGDMSRGYQLILDYPAGMLRLREHYVWDQRGDLAAIPLTRSGDAHTEVDLLLHGDILEVNINQRETLVARLAKHAHGSMGLYTVDGAAHVRGWRMESFAR